MRPLSLYKPERLRWADARRKSRAGSFLLGELGDCVGRAVGSMGLVGVEGDEKPKHQSIGAKQARCLACCISSLRENSPVRH